ncbi:hypothetical protein DID80_04280 [Candidatus Marinamargulisbacteria bacterium SCGC AAA071-K20]|nr:hypothetical protein DID80_04280 [Candidatus Marinamargulisbacteria bacterium SCGC AAA071-K20]
MRQQNALRGGLLGLTLLFLSFAACGKVTQETTLKKEPPSFTLKYNVDIEDTEFDMGKVSPNMTKVTNEFNVRSTVYGSITAYIKEGAVKELSWGKAIIEVKQFDLDELTGTDDGNEASKTVESAELEDIVATQSNKEIDPRELQAQKLQAHRNSAGSYGPGGGSSRQQTSISKPSGPLIKSRAFNKKGREITTSKHTWTVPVFNKSKSRWDIQSKKVRKGYPVYLISVYDEETHYRFKLVDQEAVSGNSTVNAQGISDYDTFISIIGMKFLESDAPIELKLGDLMKLYDIKFFALIDYTFPTNLVKRFDYENPLFQFNRPMETVYTMLYQLFIVDPDDALQYLQGLEESAIGKQAFDHLKSTIEKYKLSSEKE